MKKMTLKRMLILPLILLIPVNLLVLVVSILNLRSDTETLRLSVENHMSRAAEQFFETIKKIDEQIYLNVVTDNNYINLGENDKGYTDSSYYLAAIELLDTLNNIVSIEPVLESIFVRFENTGEIFQRGQLEESLKKILVSSDINEEYPKIIIDNEKNPSYIGLIRKNQYGLIGYQADISEFLDNIYEDIIPPDNVAVVRSSELIPENKDGFTVLSAEIPELGIICRSYYPAESFFGKLSLSTIIVFILSIISIIATPIIVSYYYRQIYIPVNALNTGINTVKQGRLDYRIRLDNYSGENEFVDTIRYFNEMVDQINSMKISMYELQLNQKELRLDYYSQQIRPHFILNVLNTIYTYRPEQWELAQKLIMNLVEYFRYIVNIKKDFVPLAQEMVFVRNYLEIQKQRLEGTFTCLVSWEHILDDELVPPLIVSSFVENCIKHGLTSSGTDCIAVTVVQEKEQMSIKICDSGTGFSPQTIEALQEYQADKKISEVLGKGIVNTIDRLDLYYGSRYSLEFRNEGGAAVQLILPKKTGKDV
ncbi:MAG: histidine kinase [Parasporobacterium sp.]|nr:histidine kinase [Parasporobacterium sp.]